MFLHDRWVENVREVVAGKEVHWPLGVDDSKVRWLMEMETKDEGNSSTPLKEEQVLFREDALVNVSIEKQADYKSNGYIRIRSKEQGIGLSLEEEGFC
ncbi:hypothetical protein RIF29_14477 [Crotalaria pallida]|uniref:Coatomer beta subunit appendage platform domain-containing protein n=1 Tax=Crotalaria pallida TaxID=3830 RepID=A0AAN9IAC2_CROPI